MGTPDFAVPTLELIHKELGVCLVITNPDKAKGRGQKVAESAVKLAANRLNIPILQPESLKSEEFALELSKFNPDIICVVAFKILPPAIYEQAKIASFNIHASLLPRYRGAAPINHAIINGEKITGVTSFILNRQVDTGSILFTKEIEISEDMTAGELHDALSPLGAELALDTCRALISGRYEPKMQDDTKACPAPKIFKDTCKIDWTKSALEVKNFIHGLSPYPAAWTTLNGKLLKIQKCRLNKNVSQNPIGSIIFNRDSIIAVCGDYQEIEILELQTEGKRAMNSKDFLLGWRGEKQLIFD